MMGRTYYKLILFIIMVLYIGLAGCDTINLRDAKRVSIDLCTPGPSKQRATPADSSFNADPTQPYHKESMIPYNGYVEHIFFHPLIVYPELAFDNDFLSKGYNDWFVTVIEFKKILQSLYDKGFILVDINEIYEVASEQGKETIKKKALLLPEGKKPLIISIDDLNYYEYMVQNGNAHKLVPGPNGNIATYSITPKGEKVISCDNEIIAIVDGFVKEHADFSLDGAKGTIALTGYEGILGYRTHKTDSRDFENEKTEALKIVKRLKETGWNFACHGYGHLDTKKVSYPRLVKDTGRWKTEVESIIGPTAIYIYPFGSEVPPNDKKFKYLQDQGFRVFCSVGANRFTEYAHNYILMDRRPIDGISFHYNSQKLRDLFDVPQIIDSIRPKEY